MPKQILNQTLIIAGLKNETARFFWKIDRFLPGHTVSNSEDTKLDVAWCDDIKITLHLCEIYSFCEITAYQDVRHQAPIFVQWFGKIRGIHV